MCITVYVVHSSRSFFGFYLLFFTFLRVNSIFLRFSFSILAAIVVGFFFVDFIYPRTTKNWIAQLKCESESYMLWTTRSPIFANVLER